MVYILLIIHINKFLHIYLNNYFINKLKTILYLPLTKKKITEIYRPGKKKLGLSRFASVRLTEPKSVFNRLTG